MNSKQLLAELKALSPHARAAATRKANQELAKKYKALRAQPSQFTEWRVG